MDDDNRNAIKPGPATLAVEKLASPGYLNNCRKSIQIEFDGSNLILCGHVPSMNTEHAEPIIALPGPRHHLRRIDP